jgi:predicted nucleic acid-binding protein
VQKLITNGRADAMKMFCCRVNCIFRGKVRELDKEIVNEAANYILSYKKKGITLDFVDATIAATCKLTNLMLMTYNTDHYPMQEVEKFIIPA